LGSLLFVFKIKNCLLFSKQKTKQKQLGSRIPPSAQSSRFAVFVYFNFQNFEMSQDFSIKI